MWSNGSGALDVSDSLVSMLVYSAEEGRKVLSGGSLEIDKITCASGL